MSRALGITAGLVIFGALVPAVKIELDEYLSERGRDHHRTAFGTGDGRLSRLLEIGVVAARWAPLVALVMLGVGVYGATQLDTSFPEEEFLAEDPPGWTQDRNCPGRSPPASTTSSSI